MTTGGGGGGQRRTAIMQPYFFPYIGYYQLLHACHRFIALDDAAFIKKGWINRNRILLGGSDHMLTIPLRSASQNTPIRDTLIAPDDGWKRKLMRSLDHSYAKAHMFESIRPRLLRLIEEAEGSIAELAERSLRMVLDHVDLSRPIERASDLGVSTDLRGEERIIAICERVGTNTYINASGGRELYNEQHFHQKGMELRFMNTGAIEYDQGGTPFVPNLSMIDVLVWNTPERVRELMGNYSIEA